MKEVFFKININKSKGFNFDFFLRRLFIVFYLFSSTLVKLFIEDSTKHYVHDVTFETLIVYFFTKMITNRRKKRFLCNSGIVMSKLTTFNLRLRI